MHSYFRLFFLHSAARHTSNSINHVHVRGAWGTSEEIDYFLVKAHGDCRLDLICGTCILWSLFAQTALVVPFFLLPFLAFNCLSLRVRPDGILVIVCNPSELRSQLIKLFVTLHFRSHTHTDIDFPCAPDDTPKQAINY